MTTMRPRLALTLIEVLVVASIVAALIALLVVVMPEAIFRAKAMKTTARMEGVLLALQQVGSDSESAALVLHRDVLAAPGGFPAAASGVLAFSVGGESNELTPVAGSWIDPTLVIDGVRPQLPWPWGKAPLDPLSGVQQQAMATRLSLRANFWPDATARLLERSGVCARAEDYATKRDRTWPWNDAWGHPLGVGAALYQPQRSVGIATRSYFDTDSRRSYQPADLFLKRATSVYGLTRAVYAAAASAGPRLRVPLSEAADAVARARADARAVWTQAIDVCQRDGVFDEHGFDRPPWTGTRRARVGGERCFLTLPIEIR